MGIYEMSSRETVWKLRRGSISWSHEPAERGERPPFRRFALPRNARSDPSSYFPDSLRETVWKFGMSPESGPLGPRGGCQEAADGLLLAPKTHGREAFQLFPKQFQKGYSPKFG